MLTRQKEVSVRASTDSFKTEERIGVAVPWWQRVNIKYKQTESGPQRNAAQRRRARNTEQNVSVCSPEAGIQNPAAELRTVKRPAAEPAAARPQHAAAAAVGGRQREAARHSGPAQDAGAQRRPGARRQTEVSRQRNTRILNRG